MPEYEVKSFFLSVGLGDAAVHLLFEKSTASLNKYSKVLGAVLIDGGLISALGRLKVAIGDLHHVYGTFKFTSIVVTHWDSDHYRALMRMLYDDMTTNVEPDKWKYVDRKTTTFYCPATASSKVFGAAGEWGRFVRTAPDGNGEATLCFLAGGVRREACRLIYGTYCLGYDLFTGEHSSKSVKLHLPIDSLLTYSKELKAGGPPVFLCIGADSRLINQQPIAPQAQQAKKEQAAKLMNDSSILAVIAWPLMVSGKPRLSLYTGGDAEEDREVEVLKWVGNGAVQSTIDVIKLGHHGSHNATPELMGHCRTQYFVVSAGEDHGHPSKQPEGDADVPSIRSAG